MDVHDASISIKPPEWLAEEFKVVNQSVSFYGLCKGCQEQHLSSNDEEI
jgi:Fe2+ or Zn2+ uptake regulation protein